MQCLVLISDCEKCQQERFTYLAAYAMSIYDHEGSTPQKYLKKRLDCLNVKYDTGSASINTNIINSEICNIYMMGKIS